MRDELCPQRPHHIQAPIKPFMDSALVSRSNSLVLSPGRGHCVVFLGKTLNFRSASLHQVHKWVTENLMLRVTLWWTSIPSRGGSIEILLAASCYRNLDKLRPDWPIGSYADFIKEIIYCSGQRSKKIRFCFKNLIFLSFNPVTRRLSVVSVFRAVAFFSSSLLGLIFIWH